MTLKIAIDGPSGAGKSTIAKEIAREKQIAYLDTGAMYRGVGYYVLSLDIDPQDEEAVKAVLPNIDMQIFYQDGQQQVVVSGENVTPYIREHKISMAASTVSKIPEVRTKLVDLQRKIAEQTDCVLDGRDIGSNVLPDAQYKFFITATSEERAIRRHLELQHRGQDVPYEQVLADIQQRDRQDSTRACAPLRATEDAIIIDTTGLSIEKVQELINCHLCK